MATLRISGGDLVLPTAAVGDEQVRVPGAGENGISVTKLRHLYKPGTNFGNVALTDTPTSVETIVFIASTAGTLRGVHALLHDTGTVGQVDYDLKVNAVSVLSSTFNVNSGDTDRAVKDGVISSTSFAAGDVISLQQTLSGSDGTGPFAWVELEENAG